MKYGDLPLLIPFLATVYILAVYGLLKIAQYQCQGKSIISSNTKKASQQ